MTKFVDVVNLDNNKIINLADPVDAQDAATRAYVLARVAEINGMTVEQVQDIVGAMFADDSVWDYTYDDTGALINVTIKTGGITIAQLATDPLARANHTGTQLAATISDFAAAVAALSINAATLEGNTLAQIQTAITNAIVDGAPGALDTLNEIAATLGDNPNAITDILAALALRVQRYGVAIGDGTTTTFTVTHNLGTKDVIVQVYEAGDDFEEVGATVKRPTLNTVTVTFGSAPTAGQYRVVVQGRAD